MSSWRWNGWQSFMDSPMFWWQGSKRTRSETGYEIIPGSGKSLRTAQNWRLRPTPKAAMNRVSTFNLHGNCLIKSQSGSIFVEICDNNQILWKSLINREIKAKHNLQTLLEGLAWRLGLSRWQRRRSSKMPKILDLPTRKNVPIRKSRLSLSARIGLMRCDKLVTLCN